MLFRSKNETEADLAGLQRFLKTGYDASTLGGAFDIMEYSRLPYTQTIYKKSFLETADLSFPPSYFLKKTKAIEPEDDDSLATHPAAKLRREAVMEKLKGIDQSGKKKFIVGEQEFFTVQKICRYEMSDIDLHYREYEAAFYNTYLLMQNDPNSLYLKKCIAKSIYGLSKYANSDRFDEAHDEYEDVQGPPQQVYYFFYSMKPEELNALAVEYLYNLKKEYPNDKEIAAMTKDIFDELPKYHDDISFYSKQPKPASLDSLFAADTTAKIPVRDEKEKTDKKKTVEVQVASKYDKKHIEAKKQDKNTFIRYAFVDLLKDPAFVSDYNKAVADYKEVQKQKDYEETEEYKKAERKLERRERRKGVALGLNKVVIVNPFYYKVDASNKNSPVKLVASEMAQKDLDNSIKNNASLAGLNCDLIDMKDLTANSADIFNDLSVMNNYLTEVNQHGDMHFVNYMTDDIQAITKKYGTPYFDWTGVMCFREHNDRSTSNLNVLGAIFSLFYFPVTPYMIYNMCKIHYNTYIISTVYNLDNGKTEYNYVARIKFKDRQDVINSMLYDLYLQYKKSGKS